MPYIEAETRDRIDILKQAPKTAGELNYIIHHTIEEYLQENLHKYQSYNDVVGALECAKLEFYRRMVSSYEDLKIKHNGDIPLYQK